MASMTTQLHEPRYTFSLDLQEPQAGDSESSASESPVAPCRSLLKPSPKYPSLMNSRPNYETKLGKGSVSLSAPMLPVLQSPHNTSFYTKSGSGQQGSESFTSSSLQSRSRRLPLGEAWREQERGLEGELLRTNSDEGREYVQGCIPNWGSDRSIRSAAAVEQRLSWAYYHMRSLARPSSQLQSSKQGGQQFNFWSDLRPPFRIKAMTQELDEGHPDGPLFHITYVCPLDYVTERKWGHRTAEGSFENAVHGVAEVRIPKDFPQISKHLVVLSWGKPQLKFGQKPKQKDVQAVVVDPKTWSPNAAEFHRSSRLTKLREALQETNAKMAVRPWQRVLMKPAATLADFVKAEKVEMDLGSPKRALRVRTACAGFLDFEG